MSMNEDGVSRSELADAEHRLGQAIEDVRRGAGHEADTLRTQLEELKTIFDEERRVTRDALGELWEAHKLSEAHKSAGEAT